MLELSAQDAICPVCGSSFYPGRKVHQRILCGIGELCYLDDTKNNKANDCKIYYFCSEACAKHFENNAPRCNSTSRWKQYMNKIFKISTIAGIAGKRMHNMHKR